LVILNIIQEEKSWVQSLKINPTVSRWILQLCFSAVLQANVDLLILEVSRSHATTNHSWWSARRRDLYLTTHNTHNNNKIPCSQQDFFLSKGFIVLFSLCLTFV